jgi:predicted phosphodiesterase
VTRWGILSDIHGNLPALESALAICREQGTARIAVLGDNLGRGDSDGCVALIRGVADISILGNRDLDWADRVGAASRAYVLGLPKVARADDFLASHGDARLDRELSSTEIRAGFPRVYHRLEAEGARIWLFGHTHHARAWCLPGPGEAPRLLYDVTLDGLPATIALPRGEPATHWAINVGSVGLPFPGKGPASLVIYDSEARTVRFLPLKMGVATEGAVRGQRRTSTPPDASPTPARSKQAPGVSDPLRS